MITAALCSTRARSGARRRPRAAPPARLARVAVSRLPCGGFRSGCTSRPPAGPLQPHAGPAPQRHTPGTEPCPHGGGEAVDDTVQVGAPRATGDDVRAADEGPARQRSPHEAVPAQGPSLPGRRERDAVAGCDPVERDVEGVGLGGLGGAVDPEPGRPDVGGDSSNQPGACGRGKLSHPSVCSVRISISKGRTSVVVSMRASRSLPSAVTRWWSGRRQAC